VCQDKGATAGATSAPAVAGDDDDDDDGEAMDMEEFEESGLLEETDKVPVIFFWSALCVFYAHS